MPDIVLATLNARYLHASFGLRCLRANLGGLRERSALAEFTISQRPLEIAGTLLALQPRILGLGVYIWNAALSTDLVALLKRLRPGLTIVLGGPEVSHECERQEIVRLADHVITGEADLVFQDACRQILSGCPPAAKIIPAPPPDVAQLVLPYDEYTDEDIAHRLVYVEASRGCPFSCEFCLSSLDVPVRAFPIDSFLAAMDRLLARGVRHFKFVDRTFNLDDGNARRILEFFLARMPPGLFLHFEMIPDRLPEGLRERIARFPPGTLQFEIGVQTFNPGVAAAIRRRQDLARLEDNFRFLREHTGVHVHADLIAGLPGETLESFAAGFDRLVGLGPQEIQVGVLKRLRGTPIGRHDAEWGMVYSPLPPYELLQNRLIDFADDAAGAAVRALLGSGRQQRALRDRPARVLERRRLAVRGVHALQRLVLCPRRPAPWHRAAAFDGAGLLLAHPGARAACGIRLPPRFAGMPSAAGRRSFRPR